MYFILFNFQIAKEAADRWLNNIMCLMSWCENKFSIDRRVIQEQFGIPFMDDLC
jgi:hypothetical protein